MTTAAVKSLTNKDVFCVYSSTENHYYHKLRYEQNSFQPLWRDSHPQTPISLIVFQVFVVHFKQHLSQTFRVSAEFLFIGQREGFFVLQHWQSENTSVVWGRACPSSPNRKNEREEKLLVFARHVQKELLAHPNLLLSFHLAESGVRFGAEEKSSRLTVPAPQQTEEPKLTLPVFSLPFFWCQVIQWTPRGPYEALWKGYCSGCLHKIAQKIKTLVMTLISALLWRPCFHMDHSCICAAPMPSHAALENKSNNN